MNPAIPAFGRPVILDLAQIPELKPMLCHTKRPAHLPPDRWVAEGKWDGWRMMCWRKHSGVITVGGRNGTNYTGKAPYIEQALMEALPPDSLVDGEVISPQGCSAVTSALGSNRPHEPTGAAQSLSYVIFDVLRLNGVDCRQMPWEKRRELLDRFEFATPLTTSPLLPFDNALEIALDSGLEGIVLKLRSSRYVNAHRSPNWIKVKPQSNDLHAKVIGFKPGKNGLAGMVGALEFELIDSGVRSSCGIRGDALRQEITADPQSWLGAIIEILHHGLSKEGKPRHPVLGRRRYDLE